MTTNRSARRARPGPSPAGTFGWEDARMTILRAENIGIAFGGSKRSTA